MEEAKIYIDTLRLLNYELIRNLGLFKRRAGLSFSQRHLLHHIHKHPGISIRELSELLYLDQSTMSRNVKKLTLAGWVEVFQDEQDRRRKVLRLTESGLFVQQEATESINKTIAQALEVLSGEDIEAIVEQLGKYNRALQGRNKTIKTI